MAPDPTIRHFSDFRMTRKRACAHALICTRARARAHTCRSDSSSDDPQSWRHAVFDEQNHRAWVVREGGGDARTDRQAEADRQTAEGERWRKGEDREGGGDRDGDRDRQNLRETERKCELGRE